MFVDEQANCKGKKTRPTPHPTPSGDGELRERIRGLLSTADWTDAEEQYWTATDQIMAWVGQECAARERAAVKILHRNIDTMTDLIEKIQPGRYDGTPSIDARALQKTICEFENDLAQLTQSQKGTQHDHQ